MMMLAASVASSGICRPLTHFGSCEEVFCETLFSKDTQEGRTVLNLTPLAHVNEKHKEGNQSIQEIAGLVVLRFG